MSCSIYLSHGGGAVSYQPSLRSIRAEGSYTTKFMVKKAAQGIDYAVLPLEGLWWSEDKSAFITNDRSKWEWTMMIMQPHFVAAAAIQAAIALRFLPESTTKFT